MAEEAELFGKRLQLRRKELRLSQRELAERLPGKTEGKDISRYENGHHVPGPDTRAALAAALEMPLSQFYEPIEDVERKPTPDPFAASPISELSAAVSELAQRVEQLLAGQTELLSEIAQVRAWQEAQPSTQAPAGRKRAPKRK